MSGGAAGGAHLVDFLIGGVQKGGTTLLWSILTRHPGILFPDGKEVHWFDNDEHYAHGPADLASYHARYGDPADPRLWGDPTPSYLWWPAAASRIRDYNAAMKWIVLLRDPVSRAYSHWNMARGRGTDRLGFREALAAEDGRLRAATRRRQAQRYSYFSRGLYAGQVARLWSHFPREQTLLLRSEWLRDDPAAIVARVLDFLGLPPMALPDDVNAFEGEYERPIDPADRAALVAAYAPDVRELERLTGWDLSDWLR